MLYSRFQACSRWLGSHSAWPSEISVRATSTQRPPLRTEIERRSRRPERLAGSWAISRTFIFPRRRSCSRRAVEDEGAADGPRSEEHTSELQSQSNLVCRLLL